MASVFLRDGDRLVRLHETPYDAESILQELLEDFPALLTDGRAENDGRSDWLLIAREVSVALGAENGTRGYLDHLFVDERGVLTLVEVKRGADGRIRREVVGQLLDYAANAAYTWTPTSLQQALASRLAGTGISPARAVLDAFEGLDSAEDLWAAVERNLDEQRFRLVFVADEIPAELRRIIEYLNQQMTVTEVLGIEVKQYADRDGLHQTLVPRTVGDTETAKRVKAGRASASWSRDRVLDALEESCGGALRAVGERLVAWLDAQPDLLESYGNGTRAGSLQAGLPDHPSYLWPFVLWTTGTVEIQFVHIAKRAPFDDLALRDEFRTRLLEIPGITLPAIEDAKRPPIPLEALRDERGFNAFTSALAWAYAQSRELAT